MTVQTVRLSRCSPKNLASQSVVIFEERCNFFAKPSNELIHCSWTTSNTNIQTNGTIHLVSPALGMQLQIRFNIYNNGFIRLLCLSIQAICSFHCLAFGYPNNFFAQCLPAIVSDRSATISSTILINSSIPYSRPSSRLPGIQARR